MAVMTKCVKNVRCEVFVGGVLVSETNEERTVYTTATGKEFVVVSGKRRYLYRRGYQLKYLSARNLRAKQVDGSAINCTED